MLTAPRDYPFQPNQLATGLDRNLRADIEAGSVKWRQWVLLVIGALLGYLLVGALVAFDPNGVVSIKAAAGKVVQVPVADANGNAWAAFVLAIPVLYLGLLQALRVKLSDRLAEAAGVFAGGLAIGGVSEPIRPSWLPGAVVGIAIAAVGITATLRGRHGSA
ncbi:MAG: hypothetical protein ABSG93_18140 [Solirubrobacteraceae bacterium]|jgi:hypothetical protein